MFYTIGNNALQFCALLSVWIWTYMYKKVATSSIGARFRHGICAYIVSTIFVLFLTFQNVLTYELILPGDEIWNSKILKTTCFVWRHDLLWRQSWLMDSSPPPSWLDRSGYPKWMILCLLTSQQIQNCAVIQVVDVTSLSNSKKYIRAHKTGWERCLYRENVSGSLSEVEFWVVFRF